MSGLSGPGQLPLQKVDSNKSSRGKHKSCDYFTNHTLYRWISLLSLSTPSHPNAPLRRSSSSSSSLPSSLLTTQRTMAAMLEFRTQGFNPYAVKYSPYHDSRIAVGTAANFGIVGNGRLFALALTAQGIQVEKTCVLITRRRESGARLTKD